MKICVSGTANVGKSTFINDFLKEWPIYKKADNSYREKVKKDPKVKLNKEGDEDSQKIIRDAIIDQAAAYTKKDNVVFDRCIFDYFAYTMWMNNYGKISDLFVEQQLPIVKETLKLYDIIFFIPLLDKYPIEIVPSEDGLRELDPQFRSEVDNIMKAMYSDYVKMDTKKVIFPNEDCPAMIELFGSREERIQMAKLYINANGKPFGESDSLIADAIKKT